MRALVLPRFGLEHLTVGDVPTPDEAALGPGEVLVRLEGAALNARDLRVVEGVYDPRFPLPLVPCSDGAGKIVALGPEVESVRVGDRVLPAFAPRWQSGPPVREAIRATFGAPLPGTAAEFLVAPASALVPAPSHLSAAEASTLCCAGTTAWRALVELSGASGRDGSLEGQWVLCLGSGGVSVFALQIAKALGARVAVTSGSEEKLALLRSLGADLTIDYQATPQWGRAVREATGGVHQVIEVGGAGTLEQSLRAVLPGGTIHLIGVLAGGRGAVDLTAATMNQIRIQGVLVGPRESLVGVADLYERKQLSPHVHATYALEDGVAAFRALAAGGHVGKIALQIAEPR